MAFCGSNFHAPENIFKPFGYVFNSIGILISQGKQKKAYATDATMVWVAGQKAAPFEGTVPYNYVCF